MQGTHIAQNGTRPQHPDRRFQRTLWLFGTLAAVFLASAAVRWLGNGRLQAQSPPRTASAPTRTPTTGEISPARPSAAPSPATNQLRSAANATVAPAVQGQAAGSGGSTLPAGQSRATGGNTLSVMAVVNGVQITRAELGRECIRRYGEEVLESMVNRQLIAEACAKQGIQVTDADVSAEIDRIANRFGLTRERWLTLLQEERGFSEQQYRREVLWPMLALRQLVAAQTEVTQEDLKKALESEFGPRVRARLIALDSKSKAEQVRAEAVANPEAFGDLSKKYSVEPGVAAAYGVIPPIRKHLGDPHLEEVAFSLQPGQISPIVQVANMYYILKCEEVLPQQYLSSQQLAEQQNRLKEKIKENKLRVAAGAFFEQMKQQANIVLVLGDAKKQQELPGVAAVVNGRQILLSDLAEECIARHGREVLDGEINRKILEQELARRNLTITESDLDAEVARAADAYGFLKPDGSPDVERWLKSITDQPGATVDLYLRDAVWPSVALKKLVGSRVEVTDEDLRKGFESNYGPRVEVQAVVLSDLRQAQRVWELARNNNTEAFFAELAQQYSIEPSSRSNGGRVPPIRRYSGAPLIEEEAFKLQPGELSGIVAVDGQFIILRCLGRTRPVQTDFQAVRGELVKDIHEKKLRLLMTREFDRLRESAQVDNFLAGTSQSGSRSSSAPALASRPATPAAPAKGNASGSGVRSAAAAPANTSSRNSR
jgi:parvulin-like peptidyl-prolyl isomerase